MLANEAAVRQAELDLQFTELRAPVTGRIGDRRVSPGNLITGGAAGTTTMLATIVSLDPIRFEFTFDEASYLRYERFANTGREVTGRGGSVIVSLQADRRSRFRPSRLHGLRRQRDREGDRHDPRPRRVLEHRGHVHARHVRARAGAGLAGLSGAADPGCRHRQRAGAQIRAGRRRREHRAAALRHARRSSSAACASSRTASSPTTASSSTG